MWTKIGKCLILLSALVFASELNFDASVNRIEVGLNEAVTLTVSVSGDNIGRVPSPHLPDLPDFDIGGTSSSQSTNIQLINGKLTQQQTIRFIYTLYPKKIGSVNIGPCKLEYKGTTYETQPINITVVEGKAKPPPQQPPSSPGMTPSEPSVSIDEDIKSVVSVNRKNVFIGEYIIVECAFYNRLRIGHPSLVDMPTFSGFWVEPIFDAKAWDFQRKSIQGKSYDVCLLKKAALIPVSPGQQTIGSMKFDVPVIQPPRDFFDFFGRSKTVRIESDPLYINVKPLPIEGKPSAFTGGVGTFTIEASLDRTTSEAAEPINLIVKISGTGNIRLIEKPSILSIPGVKILDPETKDNIRAVGNQVKGSKEFHYPIIPQTDGEHLIPQIEMAYFNPKDKKYHLVKTDELKFTATRTAAATEVAQTSGLKVLGTDIHYIKPNTGHLKSQNISTGWWIILLYAGSVFIITVSILYNRHQARLLTDQAYARKLRANRLLRKRLKEAERYLKKNNEKEFHAALSKIILGYVGDQYNLDVGALTKGQLIEELNARKIRKEIISKIMELLNQCDIVRFSPGMECKEPRELYKKTKEILKGL